MTASQGRNGFIARAQRRGVFRVAASYAVICWLLLQIADVTFDPLGIPKWVMTALIAAAALGFPVAVFLAWFYEIGDQGLQRDRAPEDAVRPIVHGKRRFVDLAVIGVLLVVVAVLLVRQSDIGKPPPPADPAIAVLAFKNLTGDPAQEYFSDGLAEEVLDRLGRVPGLRVIASSSSFSFKGKDTDAKTIARQLGVTTVLEGSVRRDGRKLKVNAKLIDGQTGFQLWSGSFDRDLSDIFAVQAELAAAVIEAIVPAVRGDSLPDRAPTTDIDAHDHYLLGLAAMRARSTARLEESVTHLEQAVALDPSYAQAHAALARALLLQAGYVDRPDSSDAAARARRAEQAVFKALALDASLSDAHGAYGNLLRLRQQPGAEDEYKRALELNPNNAVVAHDYGVLLSDLPGRRDESDKLTELALRLDPRSAIDWTNKLGRVLATAGAAEFRKQFAVALQVFDGDADGLGTLRLALGGAFPPETFQLAKALERAGGDRNLVLQISLDPLLAVGAYGECLARIDALRASGIPAMEFAPIEIMAAGLTRDAARLDRALSIPERNEIRPQYRYVMDAYWYAAQERYGEAFAAIAKAGDFEEGHGGIFGSSLDRGALPAVARIYQEQGRGDEASALVARFRERLAKEPGSASSGEDSTMLQAELAIAAGQRKEAVRHLQSAMKEAAIPSRLHPQLPWYRSLEGEPGYAGIVAELERRQAAMRAQMGLSNTAG